MKIEAIATSRLDLVPLSLEHAEEMAVVLGDPTLHRYIGGEPRTAEGYRRLVGGSPDPAITWLNWVISLDGRLTGTVQATVGPGPVAEIAWIVGTSWQGRGIAKEVPLQLLTVT